MGGGVLALATSAVAYVVCYYLPAMVANASPVFVAKGTPVDGGRKFVDGRRLLGDGKTWEGLTLGLLFGTTTAAVESSVLGRVELFLWGALAALGALVGDMVSSFFKRRIGLRRGAPMPLVDQLDFYVGATLFMVAGGWKPKWEYVAFGALLIVVLHKLTNSLAYRLRLKDVPW